jgi:hypothetical protein
MKLNKTMIVCIAMACVLAFGGVAFAKNRVEVKVTTEPVPELSSCSKAGGFSLEWDSESVIRVGDIITLDLDYINPSTVTLCNDIDIYIAKGMTSATALAGWINGDEDATAPGTTDILGTYDADTNPIYYVDDSTNSDGDLDIVDADTGANEGIYFHIYGTEGSRRITIEVVGDEGSTVANNAQLVVGDEDEDKFVLQFFDQRVDQNAAGNPTSSLKVYNDGDGSIFHDDNETMGNGTFAFDEAIILENTFCIDVSAWDVSTTQKATWNVSMDSQGDKFTFIPSNPQIAHVGGEETEDTADMEECKENVGTIPITTLQGAQCLFDYEQGTGYCTNTAGNLIDHTGSHRIILRKLNASGNVSSWNADFEYNVTLEILVAPAGGSASSGDHGVYFTNENMGVDPSDDLDAICDDSYDGTVNNRIDTAIQRFGIDDEDNEGFATGNCSDSDDSRLIDIETVANTFQDINVTAGDSYIWVDVPTMAFNSSTVSAGDRVYIDVTIEGINPNATNCGEASFTYNFDPRHVGTFGPCGQNFSLVYQYLTNPSDTNWVSGFAVTNTSEVSGEADIYYYESDQDMAVLEDVEFAPRQIRTWGTSAFLGEDELTPTYVSTDATLGDAAAYIVVCSDFNIDGFAMLTMYNMEMDMSLAQGYGARQPAVAPDECD